MTPVQARAMSLRGESGAITEFLVAATSKPHALLVEGEPGIGKTAVWLEAVALAAERGFQVLQARPAEADSLVGYPTLADLLTGVDDAVWEALPQPQRIAIDGVLARAVPRDRPVAPRAVGAAFMAAVETVAKTKPVLIAIDDMQWVDPCSAQVIAFAARRFNAPASVLGTVRSELSSGGDPCRLQMREPDAVRRIQLPPLRLGCLQALLVERLGRRLPRPTLAKIHEISGGNPFYAIELASATDPEGQDAEVPIPRSLTDLVRARIGHLTTEAHQLLLTAACLPAPTVGLIARAARTCPQEVIDPLSDAEDRGIVEIEHNRVRFTHPLLARVVYSSAPPTCRREIHRRLAEVIDEPEAVARHRALAATCADRETLRALDEAAASARQRGAPAVAAELIELAIGLGDDTPDRRIRLADYHFAAGNTGRARALLVETVDQPIPGSARAHALSLLGVIAVLDEGSAEAKDLLVHALSEGPVDGAWRTQMLVALGFAQINIGELDAALATIEDAVSEAASLGQSHLLGAALGARAMLTFMSGAGMDKPALREALELEDREADTPLNFRPSVVNALLLAYSGELDQAHDALIEVRRRCVERGEEGELVVVGFNSMMTEVWRGNFAEAARFADDVTERALALDGAYSTFTAHTCRAVVAAYAGRADEARGSVADALATAQGGDHFAMAWPATTLGFLEVSLGNYEAALTALRPLLSKFETSSRGMEIISASCVPDAVEAMIRLGRLVEAEPFVDMLEREGRRLDRPWLLAVGGRCRGMLLAAHGDVDAANVSVERALAEHRRLAMPFERARTQLVLGEIQRRRRLKSAASATLREALDTFEELHTPLWADRVRAILDRMNVPALRRVLSPSEQQIAELVTTGMTNRDVAAALCISPKTVEARLSRVYHKLEIHSRAELGRHVYQTALSERDDSGN